MAPPGAASVMALATTVLVLAAAAGVAVLLARLLLSFLHFNKLAAAIPGPPSLPLLGPVLELASATPDTIMRTFLRLIGGGRELRGARLCHKMVVVVSDPADIEEVVQRKEFKDKAFLVYSLFQTIATDGLIWLGGGKWKVHRRWLEPGFNKNALKSYVGVFGEEAKGFVNRVTVGRKMDVLENLRRTETRNYIRTTLAQDTMLSEETAVSIVEFIELFLRALNRRFVNPLLWSERVFSLTSEGRQINKMKLFVDSIAKELMSEKRAELLANDVQQAPYKTLVDIMLDPSEDGKVIPEEEVLDEFKTFFGANVETLVSTKSWVLKVLSLEAAVQDKAYAELASVVGNRDVTAEDLPLLQYLERVIKESLRLFPTVPFIARQCHAETDLCGYTLPAGTTIIINIFGAHRDAKYWVDPEVFDPDRFLPQNSLDRHPCAYMPFSKGSRDCIGLKYAMMNLKTFLATTLQHYRLMPADDHKDLRSLADNMTLDVTSRLVGGTRVVFQPRLSRASG